VQILNGRRHRVEELAFSHCGRWLAAAGSGGGIHVWDTANPAAAPKHLETGRGRWFAQCLAFLPDGRLFYASWGFWDLIDPASETADRIGSGRYGTYHASPDGSRVLQVRTFTPLRTYRIADGKATAGPTLSVSHGYFGGAAFSPDGETYAVEEATFEERRRTLRIALRESATSKQLAALPAAHGVASHLLFSPDGSRLVSRNGAGLACWAVAEPQKPARKCANPSQKHFLSMACHPEGKLLTVDNDRLVRVWDLATMAAERAIEWKVGKLYAVAVSPDGARVAVGSHTGKVLVWDWD
jgi:WD40 repeat protein